MTWSYKSGETVLTECYYIVLDPTYSPNNPKSEYLFKPVKIGTHYQLKSKSLPNAFIDIYTNENVRRYVNVNNDPASAVHYKSGGKWFADSLFKFELADNSIRLQASISKLQITSNFIGNTTETAIITITQEKMATESLYKNNGTSILTEEYFARKEITETVSIHRPVNFSKFFKVGVEDAVEIEGDSGVPFLKTPTFNQQLISFYSADQSNTPTRNYTQSREFYTNQTIEVTPCTEYEVSTNVNIVKDYPLEYVVYFKVTGEQDGQQLTAVELRDDHFSDELDENGLDNDQAEFVDILDEYTILAKAKAKMWVTFARDSTVDGKGSKIDSCIDEYVCNQLDNDR